MKFEKGEEQVKLFQCTAFQFSPCPHTNDMPPLIGVSLGDNVIHYRSIEKFMKFYYFSNYSKTGT